MFHGSRGARHVDRVPQPRGLGMKVFNVQGDFFDAGKGFNSTPGRDKVPNPHLESVGLYSQAAVRFGVYAVKYSIVPSGEIQKAKDEKVNPEAHPENILSKWLQEFNGQHEAEYLFQVQFSENLVDQPVEYSGKIWDEEKYPWQIVGKVVIPKQDSFLPTRNTFWEEHIRLDPWHGLRSSQPLCSSGRLRRIVYPASAPFRHKMIGRREINVTSIDQVPDSGYIID